MKIITKILLVFLIIGIIYTLIVLNNAPLRKKFGDTFGTHKLNYILLNITGKIKENSVATPNTKDVGNKVNSFMDGATDLKNNVMGKIEKSKETVDDIRKTANDIENGYKQTVETYEKTKKDIEEMQKTLNDATQKFEKVKGTIDSVNDFVGDTTNKLTK